MEPFRYLSILFLKYTLLVQPRLHPALAQLWVGCILFTAPKLDLPWRVDILGSVVPHGHLFALMLTGIQWLRLPLHPLILGHFLDPLSGPVGSGRPHAEHLLLAVALNDIYLLQDLLRVVVRQSFAELHVRGKASVCEL